MWEIGGPIAGTGGRLVAAAQHEAQRGGQVSQLEGGAAPFRLVPGQIGRVPVARPPLFHRLRFRGCSGQARYGSVMQDRPPKDLAPIAASLVFAGVLVLFVILGVVLAIAL
jgi:hypothetical protein